MIIFHPWILIKSTSKKCTLSFAFEYINGFFSETRRPTAANWLIGVPETKESHWESASEMAVMTIWARHAKKCVRTCASCACANIVRAFALQSYILQYLTILLVDSESPNQTALSAQSDQGLRCPRMPIDTFSHSATYLIIVKSSRKLLD